MTLNEAERATFEKLLLKLDNQSNTCCGCCCASPSEFHQIKLDLRDMHMAYQVNSCWLHVSQILLTKTGDVLPGIQNKDPKHEVEKGVRLIPDYRGKAPLVFSHQILSDAERAEIHVIEDILKEQCINFGGPEFVCTLGCLYPILGVIMMTCMACNWCRYKDIRSRVLQSSSTRNIVLKEWCCTINEVEYRNFAYPPQSYSSFVAVQRMQR